MGCEKRLREMEKGWSIRTPPVRFLHRDFAQGLVAGAFTLISKCPCAKIHPSISIPPGLWETPQINLLPQNPVPHTSHLQGHRGCTSAYKYPVSMNSGILALVLSSQAAVGPAIYLYCPWRKALLWAYLPSALLSLMYLHALWQNMGGGVSELSGRKN